MHPLMKDDDIAIPLESIREEKTGSMAVMKSVAADNEAVKDLSNDSNGVITAIETPATLTDFMIRLSSNGRSEERKIMARITERDLNGGDSESKR